MQAASGIWLDIGAVPSQKIAGLQAFQHTFLSIAEWGTSGRKPLQFRSLQQYCAGNFLARS